MGGGGVEGYMYTVYTVEERELFDYFGSSTQGKILTS
jgi:hypothetical protein